MHDSTRFPAAAFLHNLMNSLSHCEWSRQRYAKEPNRIKGQQQFDETVVIIKVTARCCTSQRCATNDGRIEA